MSSIGDAKQKIAAASEHADEAKSALANVSSSVDDAVSALNDAASDSDHEKMTEALEAYQQVAEKFEEILALISQGQQAANEYSETLG